MWDWVLGGFGVIIGGALLARDGWLDRAFGVALFLGGGYELIDAWRRRKKDRG